MKWPFSKNDDELDEQTPAVRAINIGIVSSWQAGVASFSFVRRGRKVAIVSGGKQIGEVQDVLFDVVRDRLLTMSGRRAWFVRRFATIQVRACGAEFAIFPFQSSPDEIICEFYVRREIGTAQQAAGAVPQERSRTA